MAVTGFLPGLMGFSIPSDWFPSWTNRIKRKRLSQRGGGGAWPLPPDPPTQPNRIYRVFSRICRRLLTRFDLYGCDVFLFVFFCARACVCVATRAPMIGLIEPIKPSNQGKNRHRGKGWTWGGWGGVRGVGGGEPVARPPITFTGMRYGTHTHTHKKKKGRTREIGTQPNKNTTTG